MQRGVSAEIPGTGVWFSEQDHLIPTESSRPRRTPNDLSSGREATRSTLLYCWVGDSPGSVEEIPLKAQRDCYESRFERSHVAEAATRRDTRTNQQSTIGSTLDPSSLPQASRVPGLVIANVDGRETWEVRTSADTRYLSHSYFRYIGKFPPQIARALILEYSSVGDVVLDPMCGGGTSLIESRLLGRSGIGFDVNPVAVLLSRVATSSIPSARLKVEVSGFLAELRSRVMATPGLVQATEGRAGHRRVPVLDLRGHDSYFDEATRRDLQHFFFVLNRIASEDTRDFVTLALLSIIRTVSHANVKKMNLEMDEEKRTRRKLLPALQEKLDQMQLVNRELESRFKSAVPQIREGKADATGLPPASVDLCILHPPYLSNTAFSESTELQLAVLGISHTKIWSKELHYRGSFLREANGLNYIAGWDRILREAYRVLKSNGHCAVVIGDGQFQYTRIPMGAISKELASDIGFSLRKEAVHRLNMYTGWSLSRKMRRQHVLVFQR